VNQEELAQELDRRIECPGASGTTEGELGALLCVAAELRLLPSQEFKQRLQADLAAQAEALETELCADALPITDSNNVPEFLPQADRRAVGMLAADPRSFVFSFLSHVAVVVLIASGIWVGQRAIIKKPPLLSDVTYLPLPTGDNVPHGGGSGGDHSAVPVSRGTPPRFSEQQITPPAIVVRNQIAKLQVEPTLQGPPDLKLPQSGQLGDLLALNATIPSNGTGGNAGMGNSHGTGIGIGNGPGYGPGSNGGCCGGIYSPGNGVSAPRAIYDPDPEFSEEARKVKHQGTVVLAIVVDSSGHPRNIRVARSLGMGLDEKAVEAVQKWKFTPGMRDGVPVAVQVNIEVSFKLY
jgi:protein TonB